MVPTSAEQILLVVLAWVGPIVGLTYWLDPSIVRAEVLVTSLVVFGWAVWAIDYRLEQSEKERYQKNREPYRRLSKSISSHPVQT